MSMDPKEIAKNFAENPGLIKEVADILKDMAKIEEVTYGFIHKRAEAKIGDKKGFLIWDYILYNEITFKSEDGEIIKFFSSFSDKDTEEEWDRLVKKYGA